MEEKRLKRPSHTGEEVDILGPTYEEGTPEAPDRWRAKNVTREQMLKYLKTGERYWYEAEGGFGSEKRRNPA